MNTLPKIVLRYLIAFGTSFILIAGMFYFMHRLINVKGDSLIIKPAQRIEFSRLRQDSQTKSRLDEKVKMAQSTNAPPSLQLTRTSSSSSGVDTAVLSVPVKVDSAVSVESTKIQLETKTMSGGSDRDVAPLVRIEPEYPIIAAQNRIEGWVLVRFNITPAGTVVNPKIVDSSPKQVFDDAVIKSVMRWKYNPKIENGVAVERRGVEVLLRFKLEGK